MRKFTSGALILSTLFAVTPSFAERGQRLSLFDQGRKNFETGNYVRSL